MKKLFLLLTLVLIVGCSQKNEVDGVDKGFTVTLYPCGSPSITHKAKSVSLWDTDRINFVLLDGTDVAYSGNFSYVKNKF